MYIYIYINVYRGNMGAENDKTDGSAGSMRSIKGLHRPTCGIRIYVLMRGSHTNMNIVFRRQDEYEIDETDGPAAGMRIYICLNIHISVYVYMYICIHT